MVVLFNGDTWVGTHGSVDVGCLRVGHISKNIFGAGFKFDLVKQHELGVDIVSDVPHTEQKFCVDFTVLIARDIDGLEHIKFVLKRDRAI